MTNDLTIVGIDHDALAIPEELAERLREYCRHAHGALSKNTEAALRNDTSLWVNWCQKVGVPYLPADIDALVAFIEAFSNTHKPASVKRYVSSIGHLHRAAELPSPCQTNKVRLALKRMMRKCGTRQKQAAPLKGDMVTMMLAELGTAPIDVRDRLIVLMARDTMCRRSELVALQVEDVEITPSGEGTVLIRQSKTDQVGEGMMAYLSPPTVLAFREWLDITGLTSGPLFRWVYSWEHGLHDAPLSARMVNEVFRKLAKRAGLNVEGLTGHSARVGMAQDLTAAGVSLTALQQAGRWKTPQMPAKYVERLTPMDGAVAQHWRKRQRDGDGK